MAANTLSQKLHDLSAAQKKFGAQETEVRALQQKALKLEKVAYGLVESNRENEDGREILRHKVGGLEIVVDEFTDIVQVGYIKEMRKYRRRTKIKFDGNVVLSVDILDMPGTMDFGPNRNNSNSPLVAYPRTKVRGFHATRSEGRVGGMENARFIPHAEARGFARFS